MSDPAKRDENVEDIVSSIRRLVSDTDRSDAEGTSAAEPETTTPEPPKSDMTDGRDALLLTPDQRVGQSAAAPEPPTGPQGSESKLGSLRQAVNGAFSGEPVLPAVVHATHPVKRPDGQGSDAANTRSLQKAFTQEFRTFIGATASPDYLN